MGTMEGARRATGIVPLAGASAGHVISSAPDPEVPEKKPRRKFTAKYNLHILAEVDACTQPGQMGALLRREGFYSSNLTNMATAKRKEHFTCHSAKKAWPQTETAKSAGQTGRPA